MTFPSEICIYPKTRESEHVFYEVSCPAPLLPNSKSQETAAPESDGGRSDSRTQGGSDGGYLVAWLWINTYTYHF